MEEKEGGEKEDFPTPPRPPPPTAKEEINCPAARVASANAGKMYDGRGGGGGGESTCKEKEGPKKNHLIVYASQRPDKWPALPFC